MLASQTRMVLSSDPEMILGPSGENVMERTQLSWPRSGGSISASVACIPNSNGLHFAPKLYAILLQTKKKNARLGASNIDRRLPERQQLRKRNSSDSSRYRPTWGLFYASDYSYSFTSVPSGSLDAEKQHTGAPHPLPGYTLIPP